MKRLNFTSLKCEGFLELNWQLSNVLSGTQKLTNLIRHNANSYSVVLANLPVRLIFKNTRALLEC